LKPLDDAVLKGALKKSLPDADDGDRAALAHLAEGSLGLALRLADEDGLALARSAEALLEARQPDIKAMLALAERVARAQDGLQHFGEFLAQALSRRIRSRAAAGEGNESAVVLWERVEALYARAAGIYMEPRQTVLSSTIAIAAAKRRGAI